MKRTEPGGLLVALYRWSLKMLPGPLSRAHRDDMVELLRDRLDDTPRSAARVRLVMSAIADALCSALWERLALGGPRLRAVGAVARHDVRFALRSLRRRPLFTTLCTLTLGVGIGGTTALYSVVDGVLLRDLPYESPGSLVSVWRAWPSWQGDEVLDYVWDHIQFEVGDYVSMRDKARALTGVSAAMHQRYALRDVDHTGMVDVGLITSGLFDLLGVEPILGRAFTESEALGAADHGARVALLDYDFWRSRFGADPGALGASLELRGERYSVIGVLPPGFELSSDIVTINDNGGAVDPGRRDVWLPLGPSDADCGNCLEVVARLAPGRSVEDARAEVQTFLHGWPSDQLARVQERKSFVTKGVAPPLLTLLGAAGLLLGIACLNVASLLVGASIDRRQEIVVRAALGAGRGRIVRQLLTESVLLGLAGSVAGLAIAWAGGAALLRIAPPMPRIDEVTISGRVLAFAALTGATTGILFGLAPAASLFGRGSQPTSVRGSSQTGAARWLHSAVLAAQVGLSIVLLVGGGLFGRSLSHLMSVDPGFSTEGLVTMGFSLPVGRARNPEADRAFQNEVLETVRGLPGMVAVGAANELPFPGGRYSNSFDYYRAGERRRATLWNRSVTPDYLSTMGVPLLEGRGLRTSDGPGDPRVVVVSQSLAQRLWPDESPIGQVLSQGDAQAPWSVVGVVGDTRHKTLAAEPQPTLYRPNDQEPYNQLYLVARTTRPSSDALGEIQRAIWGLDPAAPVFGSGVMSDLVAASEADDSFRTVLMWTFAAVAALLTAAGIFGVTARRVSARTREIGIRSALGATSGRLIGAVVGDGLRAAMAGAALGLLFAWLAADRVVALLYGVGPHDPLVYAGAALGALAICTTGAYAAARRVARIDPGAAVAAD